MNGSCYTQHTGRVRGALPDNDVLVHLNLNALDASVSQRCACQISRMPDNNPVQFSHTLAISPAVCVVFVSVCESVWLLSVILKH